MTGIKTATIMIRNIVILILVVFGFTTPVTVEAAYTDNSTRKERNHIRQGNKLYKEKRFSEAEVEYRKALEENASSETGLYNLAVSLIRQSGSADPNADNNPLGEAQSLLGNLARSAQNDVISENAFYNLGNMAFNQQQYDQAINMYKGALRKNPANDKARENLRLAQLKRQQQQDQQDNQQNQDQQNQDQNQDQNKDQNKDQDQNQDQNKDQNQQKQKNQQQQQQQGSISDANAEKILKTMENEENATRRKVQEMERKESNSRSRTTGPQW